MNKYVMIISVIAALGGLLFGFDTAVISGTLNFIQPYFGLSEIALGWTVSSLLFGCIAGVSLAGKVSDMYGRKRVLMGTAALFIASALGSAMAAHIAFFVVFRILGGIAVGLASNLSPMYISEIAPAEYRGRLVSLNQLAVVSGILVAFFTNYMLVNTGENNWRWMLLVMVIPAILLFVGIFFIPESPRWLVAKHKDDEALKVIRRTVGDADARNSFDGVKESLVNQEEGSYKDLFRKNVRPVLWLGILLAVFQQITGINTIMYYAPKIFAQIGQATDAALLQGIAIGGTNFIFTIVAMVCIDRFGRKVLMMIGSIGMAVMLFALSILYFTDHTTSIFVLTFILGYIAFFAASLGPALWVVVSEIFPNRLRSKGMSLALVALWAASTIITIVFPVMLEKLSGSITFLIFGTICVINLCYVIKYAPETKGKTLEELEKELIK